MGAAIAGKDVDTTLTVAVVGDLNHDGVFNDAPNVVPDVNNDGRIDLIYSALHDETFPLYRFIGGGFEEVTHSSRMAVLSRMMAG